jgi:hypothetical protein
MRDDGEEEEEEEKDKNEEEGNGRGNSTSHGEALIFPSIATGDTTSTGKNVNGHALQAYNLKFSHPFTIPDFPYSVQVEYKKLIIFSNVSTA